MLAWWKGRCKSKSKGSPRKKTEWWNEEKDRECSSTPKPWREVRKEKANSFDGVIVGRNAKRCTAALVDRGGENGDVFELGHPLPLPSESSPLSSTPALDNGTAAAPGSASASISSVSSSGSSDDALDLRFSRISDPINIGRGRHKLPEVRRLKYVAEERRLFSCSPVLEHPRSLEKPVSPMKENTLHGFNASLFNLKAVTCAPSLQGSPLSSSPIHSGTLRVSPGSPTGKRDGMKSPSHPLPLPPNSSYSPYSISSHSSQSPWKKGKLLGRGTFGHVYLGFNRETGQMCAIKEVTVISDDSNSKESLKQLNQEISLLSQLSHPNIVQYYGSELVDDTLSVYLQYVSGGSIHKLLQEYGPFREPVLRNYTSQILSGLAYLHGRNTVHRDIKGANILVGPNGEVKLADFGMAKHISSYTSIRSFKGSPYWMAPEVIMNGSGYNLSVDIWSLGCTVLEMATSKPPWSQFEGVAAIFKIGNSKDIPEIPDHLTSEAKSFLRLCLQRDPSARPTAAHLMDHPFVCDQPAIKATKTSMMREMLPSSSYGSYSKVTKGILSNRSISPLHDKDYRLGHCVTAPPAHKNPSDVMGVRMNMSLPVSPCSSPLRQFKQCNRSCFPSPNHPAGARNFFLYQMRSSQHLPHPSLDFSELGIQAPYYDN